MSFNRMILVPEELFNVMKEKMDIPSVIIEENTKPKDVEFALYHNREKERLRHKQIQEERPLNVEMKNFPQLLEEFLQKTKTSDTLPENTLEAPRLPEIPATPQEVHRAPPPIQENFTPVSIPNPPATSPYRKIWKYIKQHPQEIPITSTKIVNNKTKTTVKNSNIDKIIQFFVEGARGKTPPGASVFKQHMDADSSLKQLIEEAHHIQQGQGLKFRPRLWKK